MLKQLIAAFSSICEHRGKSQINRRENSSTYRTIAALVVFRGIMLARPDVVVQRCKFVGY